ncbi:MAG: hypothetical protein GX567_03790, partial [Clostridia bacterium]|nr:hypothetical protein [Clostridia bacterium]
MRELDCDIVRDLLSSYRDELLSPSVKAGVEAHFEECPGCRDSYRRLQEKEALREEQEQSRGIRFRKKLLHLKYYLVGAFAALVITVAGLIIVG